MRPGAQLQVCVERVLEPFSVLSSGASAAAAAARSREDMFLVTRVRLVKLLRDVAALYGSRSIRAEGAGGAVRVGPWDVALSAPEGSGTCPFPERITLRLPGRTVPWIEVRTLDVRCGSPSGADPVK